MAPAVVGIALHSQRGGSPAECEIEARTILQEQLRARVYKEK